MIDYVLSETNQTQLIYTGHSQGVTSLFILLSERPQYNAKIAIAHAETVPIIFKYNSLVTHTISEVVPDIEVSVLFRILASLQYTNYYYFKQIRALKILAFGTNLLSLF